MEYNRRKQLILDSIPDIAKNRSTILYPGLMNDLKIFNMYLVHMIYSGQFNDEDIMRKSQRLAAKFYNSGHFDILIRNIINLYNIHRSVLRDIDIYRLNNVLAIPMLKIKSDHISQQKCIDDCLFSRRLIMFLWDVNVDKCLRRTGYILKKPYNC